jgi:hypothetical protein
MALLTLLYSFAICSFWKRAAYFTFPPLLIKLDDLVNALQLIGVAASLALGLADDFWIAAFFFSEEIDV